MRLSTRLAVASFLVLGLGCSRPPLPLRQRVADAYAVHEGVKIHYVTLGHGPLVVMIHGFPDYWYTWAAQMDALSRDYRIAAIDQRGYNLSDKPQGVANYTMDKLAGDVLQVIHDCGETRAILVGHDWGGMVAWYLAMNHPEAVAKLVVLNAPHPRLLVRELAHNPVQQQRSEYAQSFLLPGMEQVLMANLDAMTSWIKDPEEKQTHIDMLKRCDFEALLNYYRANYPKKPYQADDSPLALVKAETLMIHGLKDPAFAPGTLPGIWQAMATDITVMTVPDAGHWVHRDAEKLVTRTMRAWLGR